MVPMRSSESYCCTNRLVELWRCFVFVNLVAFSVIKGGMWFDVRAFMFIISLVEGIRSDECSLISGSEDEKRFLKRLEPLQGKVFNITGKGDKGEEYRYVVGICVAVSNSKSMAGAIQYRYSAGTNDSHILGLINSTEILGGDVWISLQYGRGDNYSSHCDNQSRRTNIMIICDETATTEKLTFVEERTKTESKLCHYLFELNTKAICPEKKMKLSTGSVICLIIIPCCCIYLLLGFLYRRVVVGAKGLEQIPNYAFWQDFGNLQADGCDFICRCGSRQQSQAYRGIDDCLDREEEERDDQLLTM